MTSALGLSGKTYVVGRSPYADIVLADDSIARRHAEIVVTADGRFHVTDCASGKGTWHAARNTEGEELWQPLRQGFVAADQPLRLGEQVTTVGTLLGPLAESGQLENGGRWRREGSQDSDDRPSGRVERDPVSGEIVQKRI